MAKPGLILWNETFHKFFHIDLGGGIIAFANDKRGAGVGHIEITHTFLNLPSLDKGPNYIGERVEAFSLS